MTELVTGYGESEPLVGMGEPVSTAEQSPRVDWQTMGWSEQTRFFQNAFGNARQQTSERPIKAGPYLADFMSIFGYIDDQLATINPQLTAEYIMPPGYQSTGVNRDIRNMPTDSPILAGIGRLRNEKKVAIDDLLDDKLPEMIGQEIPRGLLSIPNNRSQAGTRLCTTTCFQMVFDSIAGSRSDSLSAPQAIRNVYRTDVVHDDEWLKLFEGEAVSKQFGKDIRTVSFMGGDLDLIEEVATRVKGRIPEAEVYCVVTLLSTSAANAREGIWHSNVILYTEDDNVVVNDPSTDGGGQAKKIPKTDFLRRWGHSYLRGHLIIAA